MPTAGAVGRRVTSWAMSVPTELVPEIRALLTRKQTA